MSVSAHTSGLCKKHFRKINLLLLIGQDLVFLLTDDRYDPYNRNDAGLIELKLYREEKTLFELWIMNYELFTQQNDNE